MMDVNIFWNFVKAPVFPGDEEKTRRARALNALHLNMGGALLVLGILGELFFFAEKTVSSAIIITGIFVTMVGMILNRRGFVQTSGIFQLAFLWVIAVLMMTISGGIKSLDIIFFISGTVIAGITLGGRGALHYAGLSLLTITGFVMAGEAGVVFPQLFAFPPFAIWIIFFINLGFTVVPLQVTLQGLADSTSRIQASEVRYRMIASVMSDYAFSVQYGLDGKITDQWIDGAFETITGYTPEEYFVKGGWTAILHPDDKEQDDRDMANLRANQKVVTEVRIIRKDGSVRWVRGYANPEWDDQNDRLASIYGAVQDVTESKNTEIELQDREAILEVVADAANTFLKISEWNAEIWQTEVGKLLGQLGVAIHASHAYIFENHHSEDGSIRMSMRDEWTAPGFTGDLSNPKFQNMSLEENYLQSWNDEILRGLPFVGDIECLSSQDMESLRSNGIQALLDVPILVDGQWWGTIGFDEMAQTRTWSTAEVGALVVAANLLSAAIKRRQMDLTLQNDLRQLEILIEELEKRNAESETLHESAAIVAATLERAETLSLILEQTAKVVPYKSASVQLINGDNLEIVSSKGLDFINQNVGIQFPISAEEPAYPVIQGKLPYILYDDVQISIPSFNEIPHNDIHAWMAVPLKVKGKVIGIIALDGYKAGQFTQKDAELAVTYANQVAIALENSRLFSELQSELSQKQNLIQELENKNAELERFTYTVSHDLRSPIVTIQGFLGYLEKDANEGNMDAFHKDLQRISKATLRMDKLLKDVLELSRIGRLINKRQDVPFADLVKDAMEIVHGRLEARGITLQTHPSLPIVHVDRPRLTEVLQNLIDNAAKYMGDQANPVIEIGTEGRDESGNPIFFVRDNGIGIPFEYYERIFGLFDKLDATSEGTGVGLALVKRIVEFHGGRIWVASDVVPAGEVGGGSTFYFTLPRPL
jgi:PAS domain S-box-containing protein